MPQSAPQKNRQSPAKQPPAAKQPQKPMPVKSTPDAAAEDHVYGLISVLYHALQGAETYEKYIDDAERAGDDDLVRFFEQCRDQEAERASQAKQLLAGRIEREEEDEDDEDDEDEDEDEDES